jgi:hypothetical protein
LVGATSKIERTLTNADDRTKQQNLVTSRSLIDHGEFGPMQQTNHKNNDTDNA